MSYLWTRKFTIAFLLFFISNFAHSMTFTVVKFDKPYDAILWVNEHGNMTPIYAEGEITDTTASELTSFVQKNKIRTGAMIFFNSPGGSLFGGMALGDTIRSYGYDTGIGVFSQGQLLNRGICASACVYSFSGGIERYYSAKETKLGIHQFYSKNNDISGKESQEISGTIVAYLQKMGVNATAFSASTTVSPDDILWLTKEDAEKLRFSNNGVHPTTFELKQAKGETYLRIEQDHVRYLARFILFCGKNKIFLAGGIVNDPKAAKESYDWATQSLFTFDNNQIQLQRKEKFPGSMSVNGSVLWVNRALTAKDINQLLLAKNITVWAAADGAIGQTAKADISKDDGHIRNFINNCHQQSN